MRAVQLTKSVRQQTTESSAEGTTGEEPRYSLAQLRARCSRISIRSIPIPLVGGTYCNIMSCVGQSQVSWLRFLVYLIAAYSQDEIETREESTFE